METITKSTSSYKESIKKGQEFYIQFKFYNPEVEITVLKIIHRILSNYDLLYQKEQIFTITKELINNAVKANMKRLYFKSKDLDIKNPDDYIKGIETFKEDVYDKHSDEYFEKIHHSDLFVRVLFKPSEKNYKIIVINNAPILDLELKKIESRIKKAYKYNDMAEAFDDVLDDSEGAGLGLIMTMMILKNTGMPEDSLKTTKKDNNTCAVLKIPLEEIESRTGHKIADEITREISEIPAFPENIKQIEVMCSNPEIEIKKIAAVISRDPGLTTSILKLANSAGYFVQKKVESIEEAAKIIGIKGIRTLLLATGAQKVLDARYKRYESIWKISYKRASYAQKIAMQLKMNRISDLAYLASLLADIGRIILLSIDPETLNNLKQLSGKNNIADSSLIEEISLGVSHTTLGGMVCKHWGFDEALIKAIELHHSPHLAPENLKPLVYTVYLADSLVEIENKKMKRQMLDDDVLEFMKISHQTEFEKLHKILIDSYHLQTETENS